MQIPGQLLITAYEGVRGGHLVADHGGGVHYLCPAHRDEHYQIRHFWWVYELDDPQAPTVDCPHCSALLATHAP